MAEAAASPAVGAAVETAPTSVESGTSTETTQTGSETTAETPTQTQQSTDYKALLKSDAELRKLVEEEANRLFQRKEAKRHRDDTRKLATEVTTATDEKVRNERALELAQRVATQQDPEEVSSAASAEVQRAALNKFEAWRTTPEYEALYKREGAEKMNARFVEDPEDFIAWATDEIVGIRAEKLAQKMAKELAGAMATEQVNGALKGVPVPISGGGGAGAGGVRTLQDYLDLPADQRIKFKKENKATLDALVARASQ